MRTIVKFIIQLKQKLNYEKSPLVIYECHSFNANSNDSHVWQENNAQFYLGCCLYVRTTNEKKTGEHTSLPYKHFKNKKNNLMS
jgi:hypothetical protein